MYKIENLEKLLIRKAVGAYLKYPIYRKGNLIAERGFISEKREKRLKEMQGLEYNVEERI